MAGNAVIETFKEFLIGHGSSIEEFFKEREEIFKKLNKHLNLSNKLYLEKTDGKHLIVCSFPWEESENKFFWSYINNLWEHKISSFPQYKYPNAKTNNF